MRKPFFAALALTSTLIGLMACRAATDDAGGTAPATPADDAAPPPSPSTGDAASRTGSFCSTLANKPTFCADFDGERPFAGWINDEKTPDPGVFGGGTIAAFDSLDPAHDKVARFTVPAVIDATSGSAAFLAVQLAGPPKVFDLSLVARVGRDLPAAGTAAARLLMVSFGKELGYIGIERSAMKTEVFVAERVNGSLKGRYAPLDHLAIAKGWAPLSLHVQNDSADGGAGEVTATLASSSATLPLPPSFRGVVGVIAVSVGIPYALGPLDGFEADFDAVQITSY